MKGKISVVLLWKFNKCRVRNVHLSGVTLAEILRPFASDLEIFQEALAVTMSTTARISPGNVTLHCGNHFSIFPCYVVCTNYRIKLVRAVWGLAENFEHLLSMAFCCGHNIHIIKYEIENTNILPKGVNESNCINLQNSAIFRFRLLAHTSST